MNDHETVETRLARIEEQLTVIQRTLSTYVPLRHMNKDGVCDAWGTVIAHDRKMNQWIGFAAAIAMLCTVLGTVISAIVMKVLR